ERRPRGAACVRRGRRSVLARDRHDRLTKVAAPTAGRIAALETLRAVRAGALADRALDSAARQLDPRDRAWTHELVYGTFRLRARLDHHLAHHSSRPLHRLDPDTLDILRLGAYQLLEMDGVPDYAAVSASVDLAKRFAKRSAGFVNAVLQSLRRAPAASTFPTLEADPAGHLSTWGSHPRWLVERWVARYGAEAAQRLTAADNTRPQLYLRALGTDPGQVAAALAEHGVRTEPVDLLPRALRVLEGTAAAALDAAPVIVQDPAAGHVVGFIGDVSARVVDLAAAPGGKTIGLACDAPDTERLVVAADVSLDRLNRLRENVARLGQLASGIAPVVADGRRPPFRTAGLVLIDAPCTGTGTLRRHPDGRWRLEPGDITALAALQTELLDAAAPLVEPGGLLVYATCSLEREENEAQVEAFLEKHSDFRIEPGDAASAVMDDRGLLRVLPHEHGVDGAFAARLRRRA
ncbi:MAG TPA: 16S rRNA (cytosine(967)-C(5))-methyltransferase RsmB, partial [Longimicrobiales bacterium]|nr:16S rRNA (cytosine(967)-C(5))-methyltransferase RsmB [Longimicrobiales bacterium]